MNTLPLSMKFKFLLSMVTFMFCFPFGIFAQSNGSGNSFEKIFNSFSDSIKQEYKVFKLRNDSIFYQFLLQPWKEVDPVQNIMPSPPKPSTPPIYHAPVKPVNHKPDTLDQKLPKSNLLPKDNKPFINESPINNQQGFPSEQNEPLEEKQYSPNTLDTIPYKGSMSSITPMNKIQYLGTDFNIPANTKQLPVLASITKQGIADYFVSATSSQILNTAALTLKKEADDCSLNNWGLANLFMKAAQNLYPEYNNQVVFTWFALLRTGFNVKVGYDKQNIFLLLPANEKLFEPSYTFNGRLYYLLNFNTLQPTAGRLSIHEGVYPESAAGFSFLITQAPGISNMLATKTLSYNKSLELKLNRNLINFYSNYPHCELKVFLKAPFSPNILTQLDAFLLPVLTAKKDDERVAFLLDFVQKAFQYKTDMEQFGHEKYLFADETLFYLAADCEDRSVLLSKLISRYTNCKTICLNYQTHVSLAVNLPSSSNGQYITYKNLRYYHCDPTYIGATCGMVMPEVENTIPQIIDFTP